MSPSTHSLLRAVCAAAVIVSITALFAACHTMKYVPQGEYLLHKNEVELAQVDKNVKRRERIKPGELTPYIQQRPGSRLLGMGIYLGFYNLTDTAKQGGWQSFWREKVGEPPVIYDSVQVEKSRQMMTIYMQERGYRNVAVVDTTTFKGRKATVHYTVEEHNPYSIAEVRYRINDTFLEPIILEDTASSLLRPGAIFDRDLLEAERTRIADRLQNIGFWSFNKGYISYVADSTVGGHRVRLTLRVRQRVAAVAPDGEQQLENHPIYRLGHIVVNTAYDPTKTPEELEAMRWDTLDYRGLRITYLDKLTLKENILVEAVRLSPGEVFDYGAVLRARNNIRNLQYTANIVFSEQPYDTLSPIEVTRVWASSASSADHARHRVSTTQRTLLCQIQCTPNVKQNYDVRFELSTTADYYSAALSLGYQNKNTFRGAELFSVNTRGAYELMKTKGGRNSYELGLTLGLDVPRFWLPMDADRLAEYQVQRTNLALAYNIQRRPNYNRTIASASFGYSWSLRDGARFQINPVDLNIVSVPWVDQDFLAGIQNPYLAESYQSQLIAGISAGYNYTTNPNPKATSFTFRVYADANGNLLQGLSSIFGQKAMEGSQSYYRILGIPFAQYARMSVEVSNRVNTTETTQFAWRFFVGGGYAYGNSNIMPTERLFFAGGSNSMRGWQVRTLGPGATPDVRRLPTEPDAPRRTYYAEQMGDLRLELNAEYRFTVVGDFGMALFADAGNVWMNARGSQPDERFKFSSFYKQIALAGGIGLRYDIGYVILRLDWGMKLYNPCVPDRSDRWKSGLRLQDTVLHFAIGLPF